VWARARVVRTDRVSGIGHRSPPSSITRHDFGSGAGHARRARSPTAVSATEEPILPPRHLPAQEGEGEDGCQFVAETPGAGAAPRLVSTRTRGVREPRRGPSQHSARLPSICIFLLSEPIEPSSPPQDMSRSFNGTREEGDEKMGCMLI